MYVSNPNATNYTTAQVLAMTQKKPAIETKPEEPVVPDDPRAMPLHPYCALWPKIKDAEFSALCDSIKADGLRIAIDVYQGQILDGQNRQRACLAVDVPLLFEEWEPPTGCKNVDAAIFEFVKSRNLIRRHLSQSQLGMIASEMADMAKKAASKKPKNSTGNARFKSQANAAEQLGVSKSTVEVATKVRKRATPEVIAAVESGVMTLNAAEKTLKPKKASRQSATKPKKTKCVCTSCGHEHYVSE